MDMQEAWEKLQQLKIDQKRGEKPLGQRCTPMPSGTGPEGETCGTCRFKVYRGNVAGRYLKCELTQEHWTGGGGSDIKARWLACGKWEPIKEEPE